MAPFGPFYSPPLQAQVSHAERLADLLARREERAPDPWTRGRASELAVFVEDVLADVRRGAVAVDEATRIVSGYLAMLHAVVDTWGEATPSCCAGAQRVTEPTVSSGAVTRAVAAARVRDSS